MMRELPECFCDKMGATIRTCIGCGCAVVGGPTRCARCAISGDPREGKLKKLARLFKAMYADRDTLRMDDELEHAQNIRN